MSTNNTSFPVSGPAVLYFQDGTSTTLAPQQEHQFQIPDRGFVTISDTIAEEGEEHPPSGYAFAEAMVAFWQGMAEAARAAEVEVNPL